MTDLTIPTTPQSPRLAAARDHLATIGTWGVGLPLELRLAALAAETELQIRQDAPYPPAWPTAQDPGLTVEATLDLLAQVRADLIAEIAGAADVPSALGLGFAARELSETLTASGR